MAQKVSGVVIPHKLKWHGRLAARLIYVLVRSLFGTVRVRISQEAREACDKLRPGAIFAIWHNRLAFSLSIYDYIRLDPSQRRLAALVSASKDGALLARLLEHFRVQPVRGSSSRRGAQAILELCTWAERGFDLAVTPDGPRGPAYRVQEGVIALGQLTGFPIVPVTLNLSRKIALRSWDKFQVPMPFSTYEMIVGNPISVPRQLAESERESFRKELENRLLAFIQD